MVDPACRGQGIASALLDFAAAEGRRAGDPAQLIASSDKAKQVLGWRPAFDSLETIVSTAWNWHKNHPQGYTH